MPRDGLHLASGERACISPCTCVGRERYTLEQQGAELQLSQQRLFHLTACPCANRNVNAELRLKGRDDPRKNSQRPRLHLDLHTSCARIYTRREHTHRMQRRTEKNPPKHQSSHTKGTESWRHSLKTFRLHLGTSAGRHQAVIPIFLHRASVRMQHVGTITSCQYVAAHTAEPYDYSKP